MNTDQVTEALDGRIRQDVILAPYASFGIGGPAKYFLVATTPTDSIRAVKLARQSGLKFFILGGGSNILFDDR